MLYLVMVLLVTFDLVTCSYSQGAGDVWFSLKNSTFQNNSIVTLEDIGEGGDALLCITANSCPNAENGSVLGNWFFPNGIRLRGQDKSVDIYSNKSQMVVHLHHRRGGVDGIYRCEIYDSTCVLQTIYIGVYKAGSGLPNVTSLTFDNQTKTLTCTSTGGPATTVTWRRDGVVVPPNATHQQTKSIVDAVTSTYQTVLTINSSVCQSDIVGSYSCTVGNDRGESSEMVVVTASIPEETTPPPIRIANTCGTIPVSSSTQPTMTDGAITTTGTVPVSSTQPTMTDGDITTTGTASVSSTQPTMTDGAITTTRTVPVSSTQPTNNPPSDGATTTPVMIVVAIVIILVVIVVGVVVFVVGVVVFVVLVRTKKRKPLLAINKLFNIATENEGIEIKITQEGTHEQEDNSSTDQPPYAEIQTKARPNITSRSDDLVEYVNQSSTLNGGYSEIEPESDDSKHALPAKPPRHVNLLDFMSEGMESNPLYQGMDQHQDPPTTTNTPQENDIYTDLGTTSSPIVETESGFYETVYSEPIQPSLFIEAVGTPSDCEQDLQPYAPIYTIPINLPKSEEELLKVSASNTREIRELGMGQFGKVILAETVGLSAKELRLSESDDDKSKSTLVAVKKLKSDAPNATKESFEKEVNFMSRLTDRNVIRILGVCYEGTPFIMMEYMEKGDLNQYLQKFKTLSTTDSEPLGQITTSTLVHIATQIASAMNYLASHNFVHRDLATRNCLVGPNYLVKISDFGMSRSLYNSHYYHIHGRFALPVRWMAYECFYGKFSQKSDVWAFGVTMWEIFILAKEQPYSDMSDKQVVEDALKGKNRKILAKPDMCPLEVYGIILKCWTHNPERRATFEKLFELLSSVYID